MISPSRLQAAMIATMGTAVLLKNKPTSAEATAPQPICNAPINAEAIPAPFVNGAIANAAELGNVNPWQLRNKKIRKIVEYKPRNPVKVPATSNTPIDD